MKIKNLIAIIILCFAGKLLAVPAAPFLITFAQPDGSTFQANLKGDEYFSWIETQNKMIILKNNTSGYFEFALVKRDEKNRLILFPSGVAVTEKVSSSLKTNHNIPKITTEQLGEIWQNRINERHIKFSPAKE
jgi:hypothetical protein